MKRFILAALYCVAYMFFDHGCLMAYSKSQSITVIESRIEEKIQKENLSASSLDTLIYLLLDIVTDDLASTHILDVVLYYCIQHGCDINQPISSLSFIEQKYLIVDLEKYFGPNYKKQTTLLELFMQYGNVVELLLKYQFDISKSNGRILEQIGSTFLRAYKRTSGYGADFDDQLLKSFKKSFDHVFFASNPYQQDAYLAKYG